MRFKSGKRMLKVLQSDRDLYNKEKEIYVFRYNSAGSIAYYYIDNDEAEELRQRSIEEGVYWGAFLGPGGRIADDPSYENFEDGDYSNIDWCRDNYKGEWEVV